MNQDTQRVLKVKTSFDANKGFNRVFNASNYLEDPEIIIRMPKGFHLSVGTVKIKQNGTEQKINMTKHTAKDGAEIYTFQTSDVKIGGFDPKTLEVYPGINIEFEFNTDSTVSGDYDLNDMIFIGKKGSHIDEIYLNSGILVPNDNFDLIQGNTLNGTPRALGRTKSKSFKIIDTNDLVVTTHIRENGSSDDKAPYNKDDESTAIQISKGTLIDFIVKVANNYEREAEQFDVYIPIPKKGINMGTEVQVGEFTWDMDLINTGEITAKYKDGTVIDGKTLFEINYGSSKVGLSSFNDVYTDDKDVIRVSAKNNIAPGVIGEIKFTFKASDNVAQADVGKINVFNAYYRRRYDNGTIDIRVKGNYVGLRLAIGQVKGTAFLDKDNDGLYKQGTDTPLDGIEVQLWDVDTNTRKATTTTNNLGEYKFENLPNGEYEVRIKNDAGAYDENTPGARRFTKQTALSGESYKNDSDIVSNNNIDGTIALSIPTTSHLYDVNDYMNIGFIEPVNVKIIDDGNGTVSGKNSGDYKAWPFTDIEAPEKVEANPGYTFVNYTNEDTGKVFTFPSQIDSNITIKANFEKKLFKVTLNANGGNPGSTVEKSILFDGLIKESLDLLTDDEKPTRDGYSFVGWAKKQDGTEKITDTDRMEAADLTLYAVWDEAPVINIAGDLIIKEGSTVNLLDGVNVTDKEDITITNIVTGGETVDKDRPGQYRVTYTVTDSAGNVVTKERIVKVYGAPIIEGTDEVIIKEGGTFDKSQGVTARDTFGVDLTSSINVTDADKVNVNSAGKYIVKYTVRDVAGNEITVDRVVKVYGLPTIKATDEVILKVGETFEELKGVTAKDSFNVDLQIDVKDADKVDVQNAGKYPVKYTVRDDAGNVVTKERVVKVYGTPVIDGANKLILKVGDTFDKLDGVTAKDSLGVDLTSSIKVSGADKVDVNTPGQYKVTYTVRDAAGNEVTVERVVVIDAAPVINGVEDVTIKVGTNFDALDNVTVKDKEDTNLTIEVSGDKVDVNTVGEYTVTYTVKDSAGNVTTVNRIVKVVTNDAPIIIGGGNITLKPSEIEKFDPIADLEIRDDHDTLEDITIDVVITDVESGQIVDKISKPAAGQEKEFNLLISATDTDGNTITLNRVVKVTNYEPVIEGLGDIVIKEGETVDLMAGVTVTDIEDGDITDKVIIPTVDLSKLPVGEHEIEYTVVDFDGNLIIIKRKVVVEKANKPEIEIPDIEVNEVVEENVQRPEGEINVDNPNTGDKGVFSYLLIAMASAIGLVKNRKSKKGKKE